MRLYIGTSGYAYGAWKGTFYPDGISGNEMLRFYTRHFNTVEINNTFYRMPKPENIAVWLSAVPSGFLFSVKVPRRITHRKTFDTAGPDVAHFLKVVNTFGLKLGAILFQFPKTVAPDPGRLEIILRHVSPEHPCAFEFRSALPPGKEMRDILAAKGAVLCMSDTDENPQPGIAGEASWGYLRLRRSDYSESDLKKWHEMIIAQKWDRAFVFFKHEETGRAPRLAMDLEKIFREKTLPDRDA
ncbi:MAG: DUF72 domain-containing protein [Syntrophorhabdus sp.]